MNAFCQLSNALESKKRVVLVTVIREYVNSKKFVGKKLLCDFSGEVYYNDFSTELANKLMSFVHKFLEEKKMTGTFQVAVAEGEFEIYLEKYIPAPKAIIFGAGHVSQPTCHLLKMIGFHVTVIDDRSSFANIERFPGADKIIVDSFEKAVEQIEVDENTWVILVTRGHKYDYLCLERLIDEDLAFLGMMGSKSRAAITKRQLAEAGFSKDKIAKLHCPVGLDIGGQRPEELAVSIASQIIAIKSGKIMGGGTK
ncbi:MAG: hypothetical protein APF76_16210 [Desulfitibacter sp. BRH_c19]|nr:MAG: hypothetical protein APF76_16210 [Desulfitibacter sp. BRH_c19]